MGDVINDDNADDEWNKKYNKLANFPDLGQFLPQGLFTLQNYPKHVNMLKCNMTL